MQTFYLINTSMTYLNKVSIYFLKQIFGLIDCKGLLN